MCRNWKLPSFKLNSINSLMPITSKPARINLNSKKKNNIHIKIDNYYRTKLTSKTQYAEDQKESNLFQHTKPIRKLRRRWHTGAAFRPFSGRQTCRSNGTTSPSPWAFSKAYVQIGWATLRCCWWCCCCCSVAVYPKTHNSLNEFPMTLQSLFLQSLIYTSHLPLNPLIHNLNLNFFQSSTNFKTHFTKSELNLDCTSKFHWITSS